MCEAILEFPEGWWGLRKNPSMGDVWIFSGTTQHLQKHMLMSYHFYYHLRSTVKHERFFAQVYFSNETVSQTTVSTGPMKMFRLDHETMNVCQRNVARFAHV